MNTSGNFRSIIRSGLNKFSSNKIDNGRPIELAPFKPEDHGLSSDFVLTNFTKMKG